MVLASLDLQSSRPFFAFSVPQHNCRVDVAFDAVGKRVEFLLGCDELAVLQPILILVSLQHQVQPLCDVFDSTSGVLFYFFPSFA